ncbi:unnamed protein product [Cylicocyclus nassatus]|uniref:Uncharacterized protein n=1 Tax=Cylicocyclus nassatus TaxID=53992 RepID=A0AA36GKB7_CYLNA|nr:unnamed protein product [Cylicocyclus nassatus]
MPLFLSAMDPAYEKAIYIIAFIYRSTALVLSILGYISMFCLVRKKAKRNEKRVLIHGGSLLASLSASLICTIVRGTQIGMEYELMRVFYFTVFLWVPCTDIVTTFWIVASLRHSVNPFKAPRTSIANANSKIAFPSSRQ